MNRQPVFRTSVMKNGFTLLQVWNADGKQTVEQTYGPPGCNENVEKKCQKLIEQGFKRIVLREVKCAVRGKSIALSEPIRQTIFALRGNPDTGKSTTIRLAYLEYLSTTAHVTVEDFRQLGDESHDFFAILAVAENRVAFVNRGDIEDHLAIDLAEMEVKECVVIVCAARPKPHGTVNVVENLRSAYRIEWIEQVRCVIADQERNNLAMAKRIIGNVRSTLSGGVGWQA